MLGAVVCRHAVVPLRRLVIAFIKSIQRIKARKAANECGFVADSLKRVPDDVFPKLLALIDESMNGSHWNSKSPPFQTSNVSPWNFRTSADTFL